MKTRLKKQLIQHDGITQGEKQMCAYIGIDVIYIIELYKSRDIGSLDKDGFLFVSGRIKEMIVRGGENIYPKEIEDFLQTNPMIAEAYVTIYLTLLFKVLFINSLFVPKVVGIPDDRFGE